MFNYESPIKEIIGELQTQQEENVIKAVQKVGIDVDKEELIKALQYDRQQYQKGYEDGLSANGWIDVNYRTPTEEECEENNRFLVIVSNYYGKFSQIRTLKFKHGTWWISDDPWYSGDRIENTNYTALAWQPGIPKQYRSKEKI